MGIEGMYHKIIKARCLNKPTSIVTFNGEKLKVFPLGSGTRQGFPPLQLLFNIVELQILHIAIGQ